MIIFTVAVIALVAASDALPKTFMAPNVVTVPPNCPPGQVYWNGQCRDVWFMGDKFSGDRGVLQNVIKGLPNCKLGQQWFNGACRDVWSNFLPHNVVTVPPNCPVGQVLVNGQCRDVWFTTEQLKQWALLVDNHKSIEEMLAQQANNNGQRRAEEETSKKSIYY